MKLSKTSFFVLVGILGVALLVFASRAPISGRTQSDPATLSSSGAGDITPVAMEQPVRQAHSVEQFSGTLSEEILGSTGGHGQGNPLDVYCWVNNTDSTNGWISTDLLDVGSNVWVWFDPARCQANPYPFRVDTFRWAIYWPGAGTFTWRMHIVCPATPSDTCSGPGGTPIWTSGDYTATYGAAGGHYFGFPVTGICVSGPFFLGMEYVSWTGSATARPSVFWKQATEPRCLQWLCDPACTDWATVWPNNNGRILARVHGNTVDACTPTTCQVAQPCIVTSQPGDINEVAEPWPVPGTFSTNDPDGGCNNAPNTPTFQTIQCGQTIFGRTFMYTDSATQTLYRDTDWYQLVLSTPQQVTWSAYGEIPVSVIIVQAVIPPCSLNVLEAADASAACSTATVSRCLAAGTYYLWVGGNGSAPSTERADYRASVTCATCPPGRCCYGTDPAAPQCADNNFLQCEALSGSWTVGLTCAANPCPAHLSCQSGDIVATQPPHNDDEAWTAVTSELNPGYAAFENFQNLTSQVGTFRFWGLDLSYTGTWVPCAEDPMPFVVKVYNDSSGYPAVASPTRTYNVSLNRVASTLTWATYPVWEYDMQLIPPINQANGWISVVGQGDTSCWFLWASSPYGDAYSVQSVAGVFAPHAYDLAMCLGSCFEAQAVTAYLNTSNTQIVVHFTATSAGSYVIWSSTDKNSAFPTNFIQEATVTGTVGDNAWTDPNALVPYKRYVVVHTCN